MVPRFAAAFQPALGRDVVIGARRGARLDDLVERTAAAGGSARAVNVDVTDRGAEPAVVDAVVAERGRLDVLDGSVGVMPLSRLAAGRTGERRRMIDVVLGLLHGIAAALPHYTRRGAGDLLTIGSVGAHDVMDRDLLAGGHSRPWRAPAGLAH